MLFATAGSLIWDASFAVVNLLQPRQQGSPCLRDLLCGRRVLELGSGVLEFIISLRAVDAQFLD